MKVLQIFLIIYTFFLSGSIFAEQNVYPYKWVYVGTGLGKDKDVEDIRKIVRTASTHGINGMALSAGFDRISLQSEDYLRRLSEVRKICEKNKVEIIPLLFSAGYGAKILSHDKNLAVGIPVNDALFIVKRGKARLVPDSTIGFENSSFEQFKSNHRALHYNLQDRPGKVSFIDQVFFREGNSSLRFENFGNFKHGHGRVMQEIAIKPNRRYRVSCWVNATELQPKGSFHMYAITTDGRYLSSSKPKIPSTTNWEKAAFEFGSLQYNKIKIYIGVWNGKSGKFWIDDLKIEEMGLLNVLRRQGTPLIVQSKNKEIVYEEGKDFAFINDSKLTFRLDHPEQFIKILPESRIKEDERLRISYYFGMEVKPKQVSVCMSEPKVYEIWQKEAKLIHDYLSPSKYFLNMDEIRSGGTCEACRKRKLSMAEILGDTVTRQFNIIREINPDAEVFIWSDMFDPNHNARDNYFLTAGSLHGVWNYIPKDLIIVCWSYKRRKKSLKHFSQIGFRTLAAAYYDANSLENTKGWLKAIAQTPKSQGIMYTTWKKKYKLLAPFGDLVSAMKQTN